MTLCPVSSLKPGDMLDLEHDPYADPCHDNMHFDYEYVVVGAVIHETPDCTVLCIDGVDHIGFPPAHLVKVEGHDDQYEEE